MDDGGSIDVAMDEGHRADKGVFVNEYLMHSSVKFDHRKLKGTSVNFRDTMKIEVGVTGNMDSEVAQPKMLLKVNPWPVKMWDVSTVTGRYLSINFIVSDAKEGPLSRCQDQGPSIFVLLIEAAVVVMLDETASELVKCSTKSIMNIMMRVELEDPYTEATCVADGAPDDANDGCSLGKNKKKRYMIVNSSHSE
ncbi:hypothetical protein Tco_1052973 [Tanacetum coccineum]